MDGSDACLLDAPSVRPLSKKLCVPRRSPSPPRLPSSTLQAVPWDFTLAAVRQWIWKNPEDLVINYSISGPETMLRMPSIKPPEEV